MFWLILYCIVLIILLIVFLRAYKCKYDTICLFIGSVGSGKTFNSVRLALSELHRNRQKTKIYNMLRIVLPWRLKRPKLEKPLLYSNIPVKINKKEICQILTTDILLERVKIVPGSIILCDEIDTIANQWEYDLRNVIAKPIKGIVCPDDGSLDDNIRFFRHYYSSPACEPKFIANTQCASNVVKIIRSRLADTYQTMHFRKLKLFRLWWCSVEHFYLSDDIQVTSENSDKGYFIGFFPWKKKYDSHCYSGRVADVPFAPFHTFKGLKTNKIQKLPFEVQKSLIKKDD